MSVRRAIQDSIILLLVCTTQAVLVNISIDDTYGDHSTGQKPVYQPSDIWFGPSCDETRCFVQPNASLAYDNTWTAAVYTSSTKNMNVTFSFTGSAFFCLRFLNFVLFEYYRRFHLGILYTFQQWRCGWYAQCSDEHRVQFYHRRRSHGRFLLPAWRC